MAVKQEMMSQTLKDLTVKYTEVSHYPANCTLFK